MFPLIQSAHASHLVFDTKHRILVVDMFALLTMSHNLRPTPSLALQNADAWVFGRVGNGKPISCRSKHTIWHFLFQSESGVNLALGLSSRAFASNCQVHGWLSHNGSNVILTWVRSFLWCHPTLVKLGSG